MVMKILMLTAGAIVAPAYALAQEPHRIEVEAFYGMCLYPTRPFDDVSKNAPLFGYPPLPDNVLQIFAPENPAEALAGWVILPEDGIDKGLVVVSRTNIDGDAAQTCGLVFGLTDPVATVALFEDLMQPELIDEINDGIQVQKYYRLELFDQEKIITAVYSTDQTDTHLTLTAMVFD